MQLERSIHKLSFIFTTTHWYCNSNAASDPVSYPHVSYSHMHRNKISERDWITKKS